MKIAERFVLLFDQGVNKKLNKHSDIWHQFQNSTPCPNEMIHTLVLCILNVHEHFRENTGPWKIISFYNPLYWESVCNPMPALSLDASLLIMPNHATLFYNKVRIVMLFWFWNPWVAVISNLLLLLCLFHLIDIGVEFQLRTLKSNGTYLCKMNHWA